MKTSLIICLGSIACLSLFLFSQQRANQIYDTKYQSFWTMADRASTLEAKEGKINKFVSALEKGLENGEFANNSVMIFKTPQNSFSANLEALKSLALRLSQIKKMNPSSFEYQTAIQQITAQEQGEAKELINVFYDCWIIQNYFWFYEPLGVPIVLILILAIIFFALLSFHEYMEVY